jgi:hypothetical protein
VPEPIEIVELEPQRAVTVRRVVPGSALGPFFSEIFPRFYAALNAQGARPAGPAFSRYYNGDPAAFDLEAGSRSRATSLQAATRRSRSSRAAVRPAPFTSGRTRRSRTSTGA